MESKRKLEKEENVYYLKKLKREVYEKNNEKNVQLKLARRNTFEILPRLKVYKKNEQGIVGTYTSECYEANSVENHKRNKTDSLIFGSKSGGRNVVGSTHKGQVDPCKNTDVINREDKHGSFGGSSYAATLVKIEMGQRQKISCDAIEEQRKMKVLCEIAYRMLKRMWGDKDEHEGLSGENTNNSAYRTVCSLRIFIHETLGKSKIDSKTLELGLYYLAKSKGLAISRKYNSEKSDQFGHHTMFSVPQNTPQQRRPNTNYTEVLKIGGTDSTPESSISSVELIEGKIDPFKRTIPIPSREQARYSLPRINVSARRYTDTDVKTIKNQESMTNYLLPYSKDWVTRRSIDLNEDERSSGAIPSNYLSNMSYLEHCNSIGDKDISGTGMLKRIASNSCEVGYLNENSADNKNSYWNGQYHQGLSNTNLHPCSAEIKLPPIKNIYKGCGQSYIPTVAPKYKDTHYSSLSLCIKNCCRRMFVASIICASKYLMEKANPNSFWSENVTRLPIKEINKIEKTFLACLNYNLYVSSVDFGEWTSKLYSPGFETLFTSRPDPSLTLEKDQLLKGGINTTGDLDSSSGNNRYYHTYYGSGGDVGFWTKKNEAPNGISY
ncbi:hypothetical protein AX774_g37 [Zancudomyces culisetae]|uniref:G1/S-specific cyclin pas1 n=1 Tax=Zancudomyces culisetae TaxID=1213189 RepID=A0A1R1PZM1_ZANCU|nr:hypothetical protein AX774_g37 [Zancudomyces culisetae]|eukprot:OMH86390.1 hypothetical protein AX774_g37 [Zancudomyces culisetae]